MTWYRNTETNIRWDIKDEATLKRIKKDPIFEKVKEKKEINLEQYHTGSGWYKLPGMEKSVRKTEAFEILKGGG